MPRWTHALIALTLAASAAQAEESPLRVVATVGMIADVAENVGGPCVAVETLMGPGIDPHAYRPTAGDVRRLDEADLILYGGYRLEEQMAEVLGRFGERRPTLPLMEAATDPAELLADPASGAVDMHLWMDASLWARLAPVLAQAVAERRPDCAEAAASRAEEYVEQLEALHGWIGAAIATIPPERRVLVTAHDAFEYYARAYGLAVLPIQGISTLGEASVADIRATADAVAESGVPAVFVETTINPRTVEAVMEAVAQRGGTVVLGGTLHSDALGEPGTLAGTYLGMLYANTRTIVTALGGTVPALPEALATFAAAWNLPAS